MDVLVERCAGIDIGKVDLKGCVRTPGSRGRRLSEVRTFSTTTRGLLALRDWLAAVGVTVVGMDSTGDYWKPVYYLLEDGLDCQLLNAQHIRTVPGAADVTDAAWIVQLVEHGLIRPSFVPPPPIRRLRDLTRYRTCYGSAKDPINMVGFLGSNLLRGDIDLWYPEDYPGCVDDVTILDVRTPAEYEAWHIPEAVLLPYTELRQRLDEVPRDKPVYTYCRSGFRSYVAYCALKQNGFDDVRFLSGGMMTYHGFHGTPLTIGKGGMPVVAHAEDDMAQRPGVLAHV